MATENTEEKKAQEPQTKAQKSAEKAEKASKKDNDAKKIAELTDKLSKEHDDYLRLMAEFQTFRTRSLEERQKLVSTAAEDTIKGLLPVLDDCERALKMLENSQDSAAKEGTELIYSKLWSYLQSKGLQKIEAAGAKFDTDLHEAVTQFPAPTPEQKGCVIDVVQTGYTLAGKVIRYAKVIVGA